MRLKALIKINLCQQISVAPLRRIVLGTPSHKNTRSKAGHCGRVKSPPPQNYRPISHPVRWRGWTSISPARPSNVIEQGSGTVTAPRRTLSSYAAGLVVRSAATLSVLGIPNYPSIPFHLTRFMISIRPARARISALRPIQTATESRLSLCVYDQCQIEQIARKVEQILNRSARKNGGRSL